MERSIVGVGLRVALIFIGLCSTAAGQAKKENSDFDGLKKPVTLPASVSLFDGVAAIRQQTGVEVYLSATALKDLNIDERKPMTLPQRKETGLKALGRLMTAADGGKALCAVSGGTASGKKTQLIIQQYTPNLGKLLILPPSKLDPKKK